jgi:hypothetical protein
LGASQISNLGPRMASKLCPSSPALGFCNSLLLPKSRQSTETAFPKPTTKLWRNSARSASLHQSGAEWRIPRAMSSAQSATQKQDENQNGSVTLEAGTVPKDLVSLPSSCFHVSMQKKSYPVCNSSEKLCHFYLPFFTSSHRNCGFIMQGLCL